MSNALEAKAIPEDIKRDAANALQVAKNRRHPVASIVSDALIIEAIEEALCAERERCKEAAAAAVMKFRSKVNGRYYPGYHEDLRDDVKAAVAHPKGGDRRG